MHLRSVFPFQGPSIFAALFGLALSWNDVIGQNSGTGRSVFIAKYAANGALAWVRVIGSDKSASSYQDVGRCITVDASYRSFGCAAGAHHANAGERHDDGDFACGWSTDLSAPRSSFF